MSRISFGKAPLFFAEASEARCTSALLVNFITPGALTRLGAAADDPVSALAGLLTDPGALRELLLDSVNGE